MEEQQFDVAECLRRVRLHDEIAARELVDHFYIQVIKIVRNHLPPTVPEEDLMQEIFMKVFSRLDQYRGEMPFSHWLSRVSVRTCLDHIRSRKRHPELRWADLSETQVRVVENSESIQDDPLPSDAAAARELVQKMLHSLKPKESMVLTMLDLEEKSVAEVAELTGWSVPMVKITAFRARAKLRRRWADLKKEVIP